MSDTTKSKSPDDSLPDNTGKETQAGEPLRNEKDKSPSKGKSLASGKGYPKNAHTSALNGQDNNGPSEHDSPDNSSDEDKSVEELAEQDSDSGSSSDDAASF